MLVEEEKANEQKSTKPAGTLCYVRIRNPDIRKDKKAVLNVAAFKGYTVETGVGFLSMDERDASDNVYAVKLGV